MQHKYIVLNENGHLSTKIMSSKHARLTSLYKALLHLKHVNLHSAERVYTKAKVKAINALHLTYIMQIPFCLVNLRSLCISVHTRVPNALPSDTACGLMIQQVESLYLAVLVRPWPAVEGKKNSNS